MMYMMTPEVHAKIIATMEDEDHISCDAQDCIAMLKSMQPVSPCAWQRKDDDLITAKEKSPNYAYTHYYDTALYTPTKD